MKKSRPFLNSGIFPITFITIGLVAYIRPSRIVIDLFCMIWVVFILSIFHFFVVSRHIKLEIDLPKEEIYKNESFILNLKIRNNTFLPTTYIYLSLIDGERLQLQRGKQVGLILGPKEEQIVEIEYRGKLSGRQMVGAESVYIVDYFGIYRRHLSAIGGTTCGMVLPCAMTLSGLEEVVLGNRRQNQSCSEESRVALSVSGLGEVGYDLQPYEQGSVQSLIHWKILAQRNQWVIREREGERGHRGKVHICLDPMYFQGDTKEVLTAQDHLLSICLFLIQTFIKEDRVVELSYWQGETWQFIRLDSKETLARLPYLLGSYESVEDPELLPERIYSQKGVINGSYEACSILLTQRLDAQLIEQTKRAYQGHSTLQIILTYHQDIELGLIKEVSNLWQPIGGRLLKVTGRG